MTSSIFENKGPVERNYMVVQDSSKGLEVGRILRGKLKKSITYVREVLIFMKFLKRIKKNTTPSLKSASLFYRYLQNFVVL